VQMCSFLVLRLGLSMRADLIALPLPRVKLICTNQLEGIYAVLERFALMATADLLLGSVPLQISECAAPSRFAFYVCNLAVTYFGLACLCCGPI